jgi:hypothetical protein
MYKNKLHKYNFKLEQLGGLSCPHEVNDRVLVIGPNNSPILNQIGIITNLNYNVSTGAYYFNPICNDVDVDIDDTIYNISTLNIKNITNLRNQQNIVLLPKDSIMETFKYLDLKKLINIYKETNDIQIKEAINEYPFDFYEQSIPDNMSLEQFRNIFCSAIGINIFNNKNILEDDFIKNIIPKNYTKFNTVKRTLKVNIPYSRLTDKAIIPLKNYIHTLNMFWCTQITNAAFVNLEGIDTLNMYGCFQITDEAFKYLKGINTLNMYGCNQITDVSFKYLQGIQTLNMSICRQITDAAFEHLKGIHTLDMTRCNQITDSAFKYLKGIKILNMSGCNQITDAAFVHLNSIHTLDMSDCNQPEITGKNFILLNLLKILDVRGCNELTLKRAQYIFGIYNYKNVKFFKPDRVDEVLRDV